MYVYSLYIYILTYIYIWLYMCVYVYLYVIQYCRTHSKHPRLIWQESRAHPHHEVKRPGKIVMFTIVDLFTVLKNVPAASSAVLWTKKQGSCTVKSRHLCLPSFQPAKQEKVICIVLFCIVLYCFVVFCPWFTKSLMILMATRVKNSVATCLRCGTSESQRKECCL